MNISAIVEYYNRTVYADLATWIPNTSYLLYIEGEKFCRHDVDVNQRDCIPLTNSNPPVSITLGETNGEIFHTLEESIQVYNFDTGIQRVIFENSERRELYPAITFDGRLVIQRHACEKSDEYRGNQVSYCIHNLQTGSSQLGYKYNGIIDQIYRHYWLPKTHWAIIVDGYTSVFYRIQHADGHGYWELTEGSGTFRGLLPSHIDVENLGRGVHPQ